MTNIFAAYLFLGIAIILLIVGIWSKAKVMWLFYISAIGWEACGIFFMVDGYSNNATFSIILGLFCVLAGIATLFMPSMLTTKVPEKPRQSRLDYLADQRERQRQRTDKFRSKSRTPWG